MNDVDKAWVAGIIDGEGSIFVMTQKRNDRDRDTNYILRVSVQSTDPFMAKELKALVPISAVFSVNRDKRDNCSDTLKWQLNGRNAATFLEDILPFLRVKHDQARLAIEFQRTTKKHWRHMSKEDYDNQARLCQALKQAKSDLKIGKINKEIKYEF